MALRKIRSLIPLIAALAIASLYISTTSAQGTQRVETLFFYGMGCPHCAGMKTFLEGEKQKFPTLTVREYETYFSEENRSLFEHMAAAYGEEIEGVPTLYISDQVFSGFSNVIAEQLDREILRCTKGSCPSPFRKLDAGKAPLSQKITIPAVISAAVVDAINPCAFAVLIILITTILTSGKKKRALFAGLVFSLSIFISYFLMGIGLYSAIQAAGITHKFYAIIAILAILIGLFNLKDFFWYGKWFVMEVPLSWRPKLKALIHGVTSVPGAFLIGFAVSLFLLPCTSGPYIVILGLLAKATTRSYALTLLVLYNLIFTAPMILITGAVYFGLTTTEKAEEWRQKKLRILHLIAGLIILVLGIGMLIALKLGYV